MIYRTRNGSEQYSFKALLKMIKPKNDGCQHKSCNCRPFAFEYFFKSCKNEPMKNNFFIKAANEQRQEKDNSIINRAIANACKIGQVYFARWNNAIYKGIPCKSENNDNKIAAMIPIQIAFN
jgi:hypothetical protein